MSGDYEQNPLETEAAALTQRGYSLGKKIGKGAYATVYISECREKNSKKKVRLACKIFDFSKTPQECYEKFFPRELDVLIKVSHPNIILLHSIMQRGEKIFIFMRYAENGDLLTYITNNGPIPEQQAKKWFKQLSNALQYLHGLNIAHRDLKCENILLSRRFNIKIADFGFARYCTDQEGRRVLSRTFCGSAAYVAPEIVSAVPYNPKLADIWSLGVVLFIMLNANMPFDDSNLSKLLKLQVLKQYQFKKKLKLTHHARSMVTMILEPDVTRRLRLDGIQKHPWLQSITGAGSLNQFSVISCKPQTSAEVKKISS